MYPHRILRSKLSVQGPFSRIDEKSTKDGFVNYYRNYIPRLSEKLIGMYERLKIEAKFILSEELVHNFKETNAMLAEACYGSLLWTCLTTTSSRKSVRFLTDGSFRASGYALMREENDERKLLSKQNAFVPVASGSLVFSQAQLTCQNVARNF